MSIRIMSALWDAGPDRQSHLLVMLALADYANDEGVCWPAMKSVAEKARITERGAQKIIRQLQDEGWIEIETGGGRHGCNKYTLKPRTENGERETPNIVQGEQRSKKPRTAKQETPNGGSPEPSGTIIEPSSNNERAKIRSAFEQWASPEATSSFIAYRRKQKGGALTLTAATRQANQLKIISDAGMDPDDALGMAEERGWKSVQAAWYFRAKKDAGPQLKAINGGRHDRTQFDAAHREYARRVGAGEIDFGPDPSDPFGSG